MQEQKSKADLYLYVETARTVASPIGRVTMTNVVGAPVLIGDPYDVIQTLSG